LLKFIFDLISLQKTNHME